MDRCTQCGGRLVEAMVTERRMVAPQTFTAELSVGRCEGCGETYVDASALESFELAICPDSCDFRCK